MFDPEEIWFALELCGFFLPIIYVMDNYRNIMKNYTKIEAVFYAGERKTH